MHIQVMPRNEQSRFVGLTPRPSPLWMPDARHRTTTPSSRPMIASTSTLRFRTRDEVTASLAASSYQVEQVRDAPDRPGREFVFVARRA